MVERIADFVASDQLNFDHHFCMIYFKCLQSGDITALFSMEVFENTEENIDYIIMVIT